MKKPQRLVVLGAVALFLLVNLFPPWLVPYPQGTIRQWALLFNPPVQSSTPNVTIDWVVLGFEWVVVLIASSVLVWLFRQGQSSDNTQVGG